MPDVVLPEGRYLSCALRVSLDAGGQTRALLLRNRNLVRAGVRPDVVVLGAAPDHERRRDELLERGLLVDGIGMLNIYDHYRANGWGDAEPVGIELPDLSAHRIREEEDAAGTPWRITYRVPSERYATYDYLRTDGTPYLRIPAFGLAGGSRGRGQVLHIDEQGRVVREYKAAGQWFRRYLRELASGQERTFVFVDSRHVVPHVIPIKARAVHAVYVMHNLHVLKPYRWNSEVNVAYTRVLGRIEQMDAMVTLTARQREDIGQRRGRTSNMFVVPNPVDLPPLPPEPPARDPRRVTIMARLEPQKRLQDAIAAFEQVVRTIPDARLDIFGEGSRRAALQEEIDGRGLAEHVTLRGFDPEARNALWASSAFVLSSAFEGYPLSTLESMSRGCPVVGYDIKYGPREQITDGVDGFLVRRGDVDALAARLVELLQSPDLVARMSAAARETAARKGPDQFLADWAEVLQAVVARRLHRVELKDVDLEVSKLRTVRGGRLRFAGTLRVRAKKRRADLATAGVELAAVEDAGGAVTELPLKVKLEEGELRVHTSAGLLGGPAVPDGARLRLRLTWENATWETELTPERTSQRSAATHRAAA